MRHPDWRMKLRAEIAAARERPAEFGTHDCMQFAARCVIAMTGVDYRERFPLYTSIAGARSILEEQGGVAGILTACLGEPIAPNWAHIGDVVVARFRASDGRSLKPTDDSGEDGAGVCLGTHAVFFGLRGAVIHLPRGIIRAAWCVG